MGKGSVGKTHVGEYNIASIGGRTMVVEPKKIEGGSQLPTGKREKEKLK